jgi:pyrimidine operon attenuation protein/uracil phosphoribosyltransferase
MKTTLKAQILDAEGMTRTLARLTHEILERNKGLMDVVVVGMRTRGEHLARRLVEKMYEIEGLRPPVGVLDVTLYRDDYRQRLRQPHVQATEIPVSIEEKTIVLVDDVLYTGRSVSAAIRALMDLGRPAEIQLAILVDRGHRELPIRADYIGKNVPTHQNEEIQVRVKEIDQEDAVHLVTLQEDA